MTLIHETRLVLYLTRKFPLQAWKESGMYDRELALYRRLKDTFSELILVTDGSGDVEQGLAESLEAEGFTLHYNKRAWPRLLYRLFMATLLPLRWRDRRTIVKTNQIDGAIAAYIASIVCGGFFVARCGYLLSDFMRRANGAHSWKTILASQIERFVYRFSVCGIVSADAMRNDLVARGIDAAKIHVMPNYVDTDIFTPIDVPKETDLLCIGRLEEQKNLFALIEAISGTGKRLTLIGTGSQKAALAQYAKEHNSLVHFKGNVPHDLLPHEISAAHIFVLPSLYEGMPKTLIEAMACGAAIVGTDVPGIREILAHEKNALVCGTDAVLIKEAFNQLFEDEALREKLAAQARDDALSLFSLETIVRKETSLYEGVVSNDG